VESMMFKDAKDAIDYLRGRIPGRFRIVCEKVLDDPRFAEAPASREWHHAYPGGLAIHTAEVLRKALVMIIEMTGPEDERLKDIITVAAIWHDYMKIREYERVETGPWWGYNETPYRAMIYHISGSWAEFYAAAKNAGMNDELIDQIGHCILAHHGRAEWGSPVAPQTEAALILHAADMWSSQYGPRRLK
jgi:3'-5' exoribonuclease